VKTWSTSKVREEAAAIAQHCGAELAVTSLVDKGSAAAQRTTIATAGQLVVATPGRIAQVGVQLSSTRIHLRTRHGGAADGSMMWPRLV
jgi:superfamily II DNA/RNA helicase